MTNIFYFFLLMGIIASVIGLVSRKTYGSIKSHFWHIFLLFLELVAWILGVAVFAYLLTGR